MEEAVMTSGRFAPATAVVLAVLGTLLAIPGCGSGTPCTDCPALEGRYRMAFSDAGVPGECANLGVQGLPQGSELEVSRTANSLSGTLEGVDLQGSVYATGDFSLAGTRSAVLDGGRTDTLSLTGRYTPPLEDGGTALLGGTFSAGYSRGGAGAPQRCNVTRPFTATRR
jgi:hypothetical protein